MTASWRRLVAVLAIASGYVTNHAHNHRTHSPAPTPRPHKRKSTRAPTPFVLAPPTWLPSDAGDIYAPTPAPAVPHCANGVRRPRPLRKSAPTHVRDEARFDRRPADETQTIYIYFASETK